MDIRTMTNQRDKEIYHVPNDFVDSQPQARIRVRAPVNRRLSPVLYKLLSATSGDWFGTGWPRP